MKGPESACTREVDNWDPRALFERIYASDSRQMPWNRIQGSSKRNRVEGIYLFISHLVSDFDYVCGDTILKNFDSLRSLHMDRQSRGGAG